MPPRDDLSRVSEANLTRRVIIALDTPDLARAEHLMDALGDRSGYYKVGLELFAAEGPAAVRAVRDRGHRVFLDLKLHDIPETVARATRAVARLGVELVTVHAAGGPAMLQAAAAAAREGADGAGYAPTLLGVTILTSLDRPDLDAVGLAPGRPVNDVVVDLGRMAVDSGCGGLIAAGSDARALRAAVGPDARIVTPGVRPVWAAAHDQKRIVTPAAALAAGADYVVVGRAVTAAPDPAGAFDRLME